MPPLSILLTVYEVLWGEGLPYSPRCQVLGTLVHGFLLASTSEAFPSSRVTAVGMWGSLTVPTWAGISTLKQDLISDVLGSSFPGTDHSPDYRVAIFALGGLSAGAPRKKQRPSPTGE